MNRFPVVSIVCLMISSVGYSQYPWEVIPHPPADVYDIVCDSSGQRLYLSLNDGLLWRSDDGGETWDELLDVLNHTVRRRTFDIQLQDADAETVIVNNLYPHHPRYLISEDSGQHWRRLINVSLDVVSVFFNRFHPDRIDLRDEEWIRATPDLGHTWYNMYWMGRGGDFLVQHTFRDSAHYTHFQGIQESLDMMTSWHLHVNPYDVIAELKPETDLVSITDMKFHRNGDEIYIGSYYSGMDRGFWFLRYNSEDESWTLCDSMFIDPDHEGVLVNYEVFETNDSTVLANVYDLADDRSGLFRSTDSGHSFVEINPAWRPFQRLELKRNRYSDICLINTEIDGVFKSVDGGLSWTPVPLPPVGHTSKYEISGEHLFLVPRGSKYIEMYDFSTSQWTTFTDTDSYREPPFHIQGDTVFATRYDNLDSDGPRLKLQMTTNWGEHWSIRHLWRHVVNFRVFPDSIPTLFVSLDEEQGKSIEITTPFAYPRRTISTNRLPSNHAYIARADEGYYFGNEHWNQMFFISDTLNQAELIHDDFGGLPWYNDVTRTLYSVDDDSTLRLRNGTWETMGTHDLHVIWLLGVPGEHPVLLTIVYESYIRYVLYISYDEGLHWTRQPIEFDFPEQINVLSNPRYYPERNEIWMDSNVGLLHVAVDQLLAVQEEPRAQPVSFTDLAVYPTPVNGRVTVELRSDDPIPFIIRIFDVLGRQVMEKSVDPGRSAWIRTSLDLTDYPSGLYFLSVEQGQRNAVRKITLMK